MHFESPISSWGKHREQLRVIHGLIRGGARHSLYFSSFGILGEDWSKDLDGIE
ncbi:MAG: hypothetical protein ACLPKW_29670 [Acetobacteraceae bacterium]